MESLAQPIQMQLSKKLKTFSRIVATFLKFASNFERFGKKMTFIVIGRICKGKSLKCKKIEMEFSKKQKFLSEFFAAFMKSTSLFEKFERKR